jgi:hypothetical protein
VSTPVSSALMALLLSIAWLICCWAILGLCVAVALRWRSQAGARLAGAAEAQERALDARKRHPAGPPRTYDPASEYERFEAWR